MATVLGTKVFIQNGSDVENLRQHLPVPSFWNSLKIPKDLSTSWIISCQRSSPSRKWMMRAAIQCCSHSPILWVRACWWFTCVVQSHLQPIWGGSPLPQHPGDWSPRSGTAVWPAGWWRAPTQRMDDPWTIRFRICCILFWWVLEYRDMCLSQFSPCTKVLVSIWPSMTSVSWWTLSKIQSFDSLFYPFLLLWQLPYPEHSPGKPWLPMANSAPECRDSELKHLPRVSKCIPTKHIKKLKLGNDLQELPMTLMLLSGWWGDDQGVLSRYHEFGPQRQRILSSFGYRMHWGLKGQARALDVISIMHVDVLGRWSAVAKVPKR